MSIRSSKFGPSAALSADSVCAPEPKPHIKRVMTLQVISRVTPTARARIGIGAVFATIVVLASGLVSGTASLAQGAVPAKQGVAGTKTVNAAQLKHTATQRVTTSKAGCHVSRGCYAAIQMAVDAGAGKAKNYSTKHGAFRAAGNQCRQATRLACHRIVWTKNSCAAVAIRTSHGQVTRYRASFKRLSRDSAERAAKRKCQRDGRRCRVWISVCTAR